jgi:hypothetical protein
LANHLNALLNRVSLGEPLSCSRRAAAHLFIST